MDKNHVIYNGHEMAATWPARIEAAQAVTTYVINGQVYERIRYGSETGKMGGWPDEPCHDCGVLKGQFHVPVVCDVEQCPHCGWQVIGCDAHYEGDAAPEPPATPAA